MLITTVHTVMHQHTKITKNIKCCLEKYAIWWVHNLTTCTKFFKVYLEIRAPALKLNMNRSLALTYHKDSDILPSCIIMRYKSQFYAHNFERKRNKSYFKQLCGYVEH